MNKKDIGKNAEYFVDWSYDEILISERRRSPNGFERDLCATNAGDLAISLKIKAREAYEREELDLAEEYWRDSQKILKAEGLDAIATAYYLGEDGERNYMKYPYETKGEPSGKHLYRNDMDQYQECGVLEFELTTSRNTRPGWLYMLLYPEQYNAEWYSDDEERYGYEGFIENTSFAFPTEQIVFVLCTDKAADKPYCTISFLFEDLKKALDDLTGGYLSGKSGKCWCDDWRNMPRIQSAEKGTVRFGAGNKIWYIPLDALEAAKPKIRIIDFDERDVEMGYGYENEDLPFPKVRKIREDEHGSEWEMTSEKPERDKIAKQRWMYLLEHSEGNPLKFKRSD